ncbi:hypothetical protein FDECE_17061 [Fusarium decemcellulare]|nr:hypothetical protein FDECE_17061 [Fusarium decemcellulare]
MAPPSLAAALLLVVSAALSTCAAATNYPVLQPAVTNVVEDKHVRNYWTTQRISRIDHHALAKNPKPIPRDQLSEGAPFHATEAVKKTVGRLFYTVQLKNGSTQDDTCTATLVGSDNEATLVTAGHCASSNQLAMLNFTGYNQNLLWVPGYNDGQRPYGSFTVNHIVTSRLYEQSEDGSEVDDRAFLVLNPDAQGRHAGETLGRGQRLVFKKPSSDYRWFLGYPRDAATGDETVPQKGHPEFTGERLASCNGTIRDWRFGQGLTGIACLMGGGSSGGPELADFDLDTGFGTVAAVNSRLDPVGGLGGKSSKQYLWGVPVTTEISKKLFDAAQCIKPVLK